MWWELPVIAHCWSNLHNFSLLRGLQETCACLRGCTAAFTRNRSQSFRFMQISFCLIMVHVSILASSCMRDVFWRIELKIISLLVCPICYQQKKKNLRVELTCTVEFRLIKIAPQMESLLVWYDIWVIEKMKPDWLKREFSLLCKQIHR